MHDPRVLIIGGGAAGLSAAVAAARLGVAVTILEGSARVGRKILASGNGRCNLTNISASPAAYNHPGFVGLVLGVYPSDAVRSFFEGMGLLTFSDDEGRVYPATNTATSVLEVLRLECAHLGVEERCGFGVARISEMPGSAGFEVSSGTGETVRGDAVIVTTGGGDTLLAGMGHGRVECVPVLGPITTDADPIRGLSGIRVRCAASIIDDAGQPIATERGELLFRDHGVSGIMIFDLSRFLEKASLLSIDFFPDVAPRALLAMVSERCADLPWRTAETYFDGMLHSRVAGAVLRSLRVDPNSPAAELPRERLAKALKDFRVSIVGMGEASQAQVTRGGAAIEDFDPGTLESRRTHGLFAAGEVLDIDGRCGGYNLHWAWASGIVAGENAAWCAAALVGAPLDVPGGPE